MSKDERVSPVGADPRLFGRNVEQIRSQATRVVIGRIPAQVRKELSAAVKAGWLGRLKRDGLKPEIFFHPDHLHGARERQIREAEYAARCSASVVISGAELAEYRIAEMASRKRGELDGDVLAPSDQETAVKEPM